MSDRGTYRNVLYIEMKYKTRRSSSVRASVYCFGMSAFNAHLDYERNPQGVLSALLREVLLNRRPIVPTCQLETVYRPTRATAWTCRPRRDEEIDQHQKTTELCQARSPPLRANGKRRLAYRNGLHHKDENSQRNQLVRVREKCNTSSCLHS